MATRTIDFGYECKLFLSANAGTQTTFVDDQAIGSVKDLKIQAEMSTVDISDRDSNGTDSEVPVSNKYTITFNMNVRPDKYGYALLRTAFKNQTPLACLSSNKGNTVHFLGDVYVSGMTENQTLKDALTLDITLTVTTEYRAVTIVTPAYTSGSSATSGTWGTSI